MALIDAVQSELRNDCLMKSGILKRAAYHNAFNVYEDLMVLLDESEDKK